MSLDETIEQLRREHVENVRLNGIIKGILIAKEFVEKLPEPASRYETIDGLLMLAHEYTREKI